MTEMPEPLNIEQGVRDNDLASLPEKMRNGGIALAALFAARQLDNAVVSELSHRDAAAYLAQLRQCQALLREWAPGEVKDDATDMAQKNRAERLLRVVKGQ